MVSQSQVWYLSPKGYAQTQIYNPELKKQQTHLMHRMILGLERGDKRKTDHVNRKKLDNRRRNLRVATISQNLRNRGKFKSSKSKYKGMVQLGHFDKEEDAARVYQWAVKLLFDESHRLRLFSEDNA